MSAPVRLGERWLGSLVVEGVVDASPLGRGKGISARGGVFDLVIEPGSVAASVRMRSSEPRRVSIGIARVGADAWSAGAAAMATNATWSAAILEGRLQPDMLEALSDAGASLVLDAATTSIDCSCERHGALCEHGAAVCARLAELLDDDPYLSVTLRGGDRSQFVAAVTDATLHAAGGGASRSSATSTRTRTKVSRESAQRTVHSPIAARGAAEPHDAMGAWKRKPQPLPDAPRHRRAPGHARAATQRPPAELGVDAQGLGWISGDAIARAAALRSALARGDLSGAHDAAALGADREADILRLCVTSAFSVMHAAEMLSLERSTLQAVIDAWPDAGYDGFTLLARPRRLDDDEVALVQAAVAGRVRTRSTGALLDDGRQVRRSDRGTWAVVRPSPDGVWSIDSFGDDLDEVLDTADVELIDPDR